jgi:hypothetical protein
MYEKEKSWWKKKTFWAGVGGFFGGMIVAGPVGAAIGVTGALAYAGGKAATSDNKSAKSWYTPWKKKAFWAGVVGFCGGMLVGGPIGAVVGATVATLAYGVGKRIVASSFSGGQKHDIAQRSDTQKDMEPDLDAPSKQVQRERKNSLEDLPTIEQVKPKGYNPMAPSSKAPRQTGL